MSVYGIKIDSRVDLYEIYMKLNDNIINENPEEMKINGVRVLIDSRHHIGFGGIVKDAETRKNIYVGFNATEDRYFSNDEDIEHILNVRLSKNVYQHNKIYDVLMNEYPNKFMDMGGFEVSDRSYVYEHKLYMSYWNEVHEVMRYKDLIDYVIRQYRYVSDDVYMQFTGQKMDEYSRYEDVFNGNVKIWMTNRAKREAEFKRKMHMLRSQFGGSYNMQMTDDL